MQGVKFTLPTVRRLRGPDQYKLAIYVLNVVRAPVDLHDYVVANDPVFRCYEIEHGSLAALVRTILFVESSFNFIQALIFFSTYRRLTHTSDTILAQHF